MVGAVVLGAGVVVEVVVRGVADVEVSSPVVSAAATVVTVLFIVAGNQLFVGGGHVRVAGC